MVLEGRSGSDDLEPVLQKVGFLRTADTSAGKFGISFLCKTSALAEVTRNYYVYYCFTHSQSPLSLNKLMVAFSCYRYSPYTGLPARNTLIASMIAFGDGRPFVTPVITGSETPDLVIFPG